MLTHHVRKFLKWLSISLRLNWTNREIPFSFVSCLLLSHSHDSLCLDGFIPLRSSDSAKHSEQTEKLSLCGNGFVEASRSDPNRFPLPNRSSYRPIPVALQSIYSFRRWILARTAAALCPLNESNSIGIVFCQHIGSAQREKKWQRRKKNKNLLANYANGRPIKLNEFHFSNAWTCSDTTPSTMRPKKKKNAQTKIVNCRPKRRKIELWTLEHVDVFAFASHSPAAIKRYSIFIGELC